jgi:hypothetical protein
MKQEIWIAVVWLRSRFAVGMRHVSLQCFRCFADAYYSPCGMMGWDQLDGMGLNRAPAG